MYEKLMRFVWPIDQWVKLNFWIEYSSDDVWIYLSIWIQIENILNYLQKFKSKIPKKSASKQIVVNSMVEMYNYSTFKTITKYSVDTEYSSNFFVNTKLSIWSSPLGPFILNLNCHYSQLLVCVSSLVCSTERMWHHWL